MNLFTGNVNFIRYYGQSMASRKRNLLSLGRSKCMVKPPLTYSLRKDLTTMKMSVIEHTNHTLSNDKSCTANEVITGYKPNTIKSNKVVATLNLG
jgi:hypothetical protein